MRRPAVRLAGSRGAPRRVAPPAHVGTADRGVVIWVRVVVCAAAVCATVAVCLAAAPEALGRGWSIQPAPNLPGARNGQLTRVSCASPVACTTVGSYGTGTTRGTFAERWSGTRWSIQQTPQLPGANLTGVSCASPSACTAVGSDTPTETVGPMTLVESWDGTRWSIQHSPPLSGALFAVSCSSRTTCTAVGTTETGTVLVERWDGTKWSVEATPVELGANRAQLDGVSCASPTACTAVGSLHNMPAAARWDGARWSIQPAPDPPGATSAGLSDVSCSTPTDCTAVGSETESCCSVVALVEHWDGISWSIQATPAPVGATDISLNGVSCVSSNVCTAVGSNIIANHLEPLAESWNGTSWSIQATQHRVDGTDGGLNGVSCVSLSVCAAVGSNSVANHQETLVESWNGTSWSIQPTPNPIGARNGGLNGVSCASPNACTAVGGWSSPGAGGGMAARWNGTSWSVRQTPGIGGVLSDVSCASPTACTAVGGNGVMRWNGRQWSRQRPRDSGYRLTGVSCPSTNRCMAVEDFPCVGCSGIPAQLPLAVWWDGTRWSRQLTPTGRSTTGLTSVSCASEIACTAVGSDNLVVHWNGKRWAIQPTPKPSRVSSIGLTGVSCASRSSCIAVGRIGSPGVLSGALLIERWDGTRWSIQRAPHPAGATDSALIGVSCATASACTAVGSYNNRAGRDGTLAERWNGTKWSIQPTPNSPSATVSGLTGVSCPSATACIALGSYRDAAGQQHGLIEHWHRGG